MTEEVRIAHTLDERHVNRALDIFYEAFAEKFRIGFSNEGQVRRLFHDSINRDNCIVALRDDELLGILTHQTITQGEFFQLRLGAVFGRFWPWRALRMLLNLLLLNESAKPDEFIVSTISVSSDARGLGVGTRLMNAAEDLARQRDKNLMSLGVIGKNEAARRLYERLGYRVAASQQGRLIRWITGDDVVHHMEKALSDQE